MRTAILVLFLVNPAAASIVLDQSVPPSNPWTFSAGVFGSGPKTSEIQTFTVGLTGNLVQVDVDVVGHNGITVPLTLRIVGTDSNHRPLPNTVLATQTVPATSIPTLENSGFTSVVISPTAVVPGEVLGIELSMETVGNGFYTWDGVSVPEGTGPVYSGGAFFAYEQGGIPKSPDYEAVAFQTWVDVPEPVSLGFIPILYMLLQRPRQPI